MRGIASRIDPEIYEQGAIEMTRYGVIKRATGKGGSAVFGEFSQSGNQFAIERPGGGHHIDPEKALANNRGYVYAAVNAKAREVQNIDFRLFEVDGEDHKEKTEHEALDLLDGVNLPVIPMGLVFKIPQDICVYQQFTGLKDKNGKEIYEGDIVRCSEIEDDPYSQNFEIIFGDDNYAAFDLKGWTGEVNGLSFG